ncbi:hypothetical protein P7228_12765 [Altererythrobacter arenosus]|uniref:NIPSNAP domain-containing protein n=1 Tax=Altererythrobacter arenosus TaxID=3032592 RepID=A0ABY8FPC8_9SPHN|nr:hypothetical protein [Altererythrobacter sp. CAU 1644]WFL76859.1 hypothetical protein P7228_12765 [Altererythrobacter sp. CAU 1644]
MITRIAFGIAAASLAFTATPAFAQDEPEEPRTTYRIEFLKLKPGAGERWTEMGEKYWGPATEKAGLPQPEVHWLMSGPWDIMMVFKMPRGLAMLDSHNPPERVAFRKAFAEVAGGEDEAKKLIAEDNEIVANSMVTYSHTHP